MSNPWLNYHHLYYFYTVAREGNITRASKILRLSQPTVSAQLKSLEEVLGETLLIRAGRGITLTEVGTLVFQYAEEIFSLGKELIQTIKRHPKDSAMELRVGVSDAVPKVVAYRILEPAFDSNSPIKIICFEGKLKDLIYRMLDHEIDLVISNSRFSGGTRGHIFHHALGDSGISFFASDKIASQYEKDFPGCLHQAPILLPTAESAIREQLDSWFESKNVFPKIVGEFDDSALTKAFGQAGRGIFVSPTALEAELRQQVKVRPIGRIKEVRESFYAISPERKIKHPAVIAVCETARQKLFRSDTK